MTLPNEDIQLSPDANLFEEHASDADGSERLQLIYRLGLSICSQSDLDTVFTTIRDGLCRLIDLERCFIATFDQRGVLTPRAQHGITLDGPIKDWPVSTSIVNQVLDRGLSLLSIDAGQDEKFSGADSIKLHKIRSVLCVPLGNGDTSLGIVYADSRIRGGSFAEQDLKLMTALSHYAVLAIRNANELQAAIQEQELAKERCDLIQDELFSHHQIRGHAPSLVQAYDRLKRAAASEVPILIQGESGTGKELFARAAHKLSNRNTSPFIAVHIAETNENLIESELFGHEKGAFTSASGTRRGKFELVRGGTIFLDEVAEIPLTIQAKLLRVLETQTFERVGGDDTIRTDFRLICATHRDLEEMIREGTFREDLYYRLMGVVIQVPALRERIEDIPDLVTHVLERLGSGKRFCEAALHLLQSYPWPGNIRQLIRVVEAVDVLTDAELIEPRHLPDQLRYGATDQGDPATGFLSLEQAVARTEKEHFQRALTLSEGRKEQARELLQLCKATFYNRLKEYDL